MSEVVEHRRTIRRCRYPGCGSEGHNSRTCPIRIREERAERERIRAQLEAEVHQRARDRMRAEGRIIEAYLQRPGAADARREQMEIYLRQQEAILQGQTLEVQALRAQFIEVNGVAAAPPPPPYMDGIPMGRRAELGFNYDPTGVLVAANEEGLARMAALPVLRETAVKTDECPICIEDLGETGKMVLKCGHIVCESCFLQQVLRATSTNRPNNCACPVCRVNYVM